jgi:glycosyltransferase involved in cell wall biosynthesis
MTLVSIGIPTRNRVELLARSARSALAQEGVELELVISDNASTDGTAALCAELAADPRVRVIRQDEDIGAEANFRAVLEAAHGSLFMWLADDDWLDTGYVSACASVLEEHADHSLVCGRATYYREGATAVVERPVTLQSGSAAVRLVGFYRTVTRNGTFYGVIRRELLAALPFPATVGSDWLLVASLAYSGKIRTVEGASIHRSLAGASQDQESLRRAYGLSKRQARHWYAVIARAVFSDIRSSPTYDRLGARRSAVAVKAAAFVVVRFGPKAIAANTVARLGLLR